VSHAIRYTRVLVAFAISVPGAVRGVEPPGPVDPGGTVVPAEAPAPAAAAEPAPVAAPPPAAELPPPPPPPAPAAADAPATAVATPLMAPAAPTPAVEAPKTRSASESSATSTTSSVPPDAARPAARSRTIPLRARSGEQRVDWYRPPKLEDADANLAWNRSIFGAFDPWTKQKVTVLFQYHEFALALPATKGINKLPRKDGSEAEAPYPAGRFSASYQGARIEIGNWSLAAATGSGTLHWDAGPETGRAADMRATSYEAIIARGLGASALFDFGSADVRIGIAWPELYVRLVYASLRPALLSGKDMNFGIAGAGVSLIGVRMTIGDALFAEARAGDLAAQAAVSQLPATASRKSDVFHQERAGFELRPVFRVGLAL
jgi:hypothetical protein